MGVRAEFVEGAEVVGLFHLGSCRRLLMAEIAGEAIGGGFREEIFRTPSNCATMAVSTLFQARVDDPDVRRDEIKLSHLEGTYVRRIIA